MAGLLETVARGLAGALAMALRPPFAAADALWDEATKPRDAAERLADAEAETEVLDNFIPGPLVDEDRVCANCGDAVEVGLSSRDWCDGCEAEADKPHQDCGLGGVGTQGLLDSILGLIPDLPAIEYRTPFWLPPRRGRPPLTLRRNAPRRRPLVRGTQLPGSTTSLARMRRLSGTGSTVRAGPRSPAVPRSRCAPNLQGTKGSTATPASSGIPISLPDRRAASARSPRSTATSATATARTARSTALSE